MDFFIQNAWAEAQAAGGSGESLRGFILIILMVVIFYFLLLRPQTQRVKEHKKMVEALAKGDEVVTNGGLLGKIIDLGDNFVLLEIANNLQVRVQRHAISAVMPKGTMKIL